MDKEHGDCVPQNQHEIAKEREDVSEMPRQYGKLNSLISFNTVYWSQYNYHREKEYRIFVWTSTILIAAIAVLIIDKKGETPIFVLYGQAGQLGAYIGIGFWIVGSIVMQIHERIKGNKYARILIDIADSMGGFDKQSNDETILPVDWKEWKNVPDKIKFHMFFSNYIPATFVLGIAAIALTVLRATYTN